MSGKILNVLDRKRFEFSYLSTTSQIVTLVPQIEACGYAYIALYARVHERSMSAGQSLTFQLYNILPSDEDAREFVETDVTGGPLSFLDLKVTSALPGAVPGIYSNYSRSGGPYLKLVLTADPNGSSQTFYAEISLVLHMRETY